ncbi:hypothetical protein EVG20_g641 [Dentipellis fragilis]|uniref:DUF2421 domain-containing protein n=1 Tax=Dentipellis fragilis TaxID=205917 RepID=A0A4Y9ZDZ7_9AGAM|nr:hypothetical protein EVG20_g641 [Dentipellis fragilis]
MNVPGRRPLFKTPMCGPLSVLSLLFTRRTCARVLSTFVCCLVTVIRPWSRFGGPSAFLVLTLKELVFAVQENLAQQVEATILNVMGALIGIALSTLARYIASLCHDESVLSRAVPAMFLIFIAFIAGWAKSRLPRLVLSARISCFVSIWILTTDPGNSLKFLHFSTNFLWITLSAASICLLSSMLLLHWFSTHFAHEISATFTHLHECLSLSLEEAFGDSKNETTIIRKHNQILDKLLQEFIGLNLAYSEAAFELRVGRLSFKSIKPLISVVEHLRRELSWGGTMTELRTLNDRTVAPFKQPALDLGHAILESMDVVCKAVLASYEPPARVRRLLNAERDMIAAAQRQLVQARDVAREQLRRIFEELDLGDPAGQGQFKVSPELADCSLFMISLLQMSHEMRQALHVAQRIVNLHDASHTRLWYPRLSWAWLGIAPRSVMLDDRAPLTGDQDYLGADTHLSQAEVKQGMVETMSMGLDAECCAVPPTTSHSQEKLPLFRRLPSLIHGLWSSRLVLRGRLGVSRILSSIQHSSHLQHAIKNAIGVALLSLPAFFPVGSPVRNNHRISICIYCKGYLFIQTSLSIDQNTGTDLAYMQDKSVWAGCNDYGIVASVTLPPIVFSQYLDPSSTTVIHLAVLRGLMIGGGIIGALLVNTLIFPRHCRVLFLYCTTQALSLLSELYLILGRELFNRGHSFLLEDQRKNLKIEVQVRQTLHQLSVLLKTMNDELSLVPKPMRQYRRVISTLQSILDYMTGLRKVRENIPMKETVTSVAHERREFVSCVCITLYACEHTFRTRQPLPQFLPSARHALKVLVKQLEISLEGVRDTDRVALGLALVYSFAESEILKDMVNTLEDLLDICHALFGTAAWLTEEPQWPAVSVHEEKSDHGWYSTV